MSKSRKKKRWLKRLALGLLAVLSTLLLLPALALLVLDSPWGRDQLEGYLSDTLSTSLKGQFVLSGLSSVGPFGFSGLDLEVRDSQGRRVLSAHDLDVRWSLLDVLSQLAGSSTPLVVGIPEVTLEHAEVTLIPTSGGQPSLVTAFQPTEPSSGSEQGEPGRPLSLRFESIRLKHAWVHGRLNDAPLDVEIEPLAGSLIISPESIHVDLDRLALLARQGTALQNLRVEANAQLTIPSSDPTLLEGKLNLKGSFDRPTAKPSDPTPPRATFDTSIEADAGELRAILQAQHGEMTASAQGLVSLTEREARNVQVEVSQLNLANWLDAPPTQLSLTATGEAAWGEGLSASLTATLPRGNRAAGIELPALEAQGQWHGEQLKASVQASDGSVRVQLESQPAQQPNARRITLEARVHRLSPELQRLFGELDIRGAARATAEIVLSQAGPEPELLRAEASLALDDLTVPNVKVDSARLHANASGPLLSPNLDLNLEAGGLMIFGQPLTRLQVQATGQAGDLQVEADVQRPRVPRVHASLQYRVGETRVKNGRIVARVQGEPIVLRFDELRFGSGIEVDSARLTGAGSLSASVHIEEGTVKASAEARELNLMRLSQLVAPDLDLEGRVSLDTEITLRGHRVEGYICGEVKNLRLGPVHYPRASVFLQAHEQRVSGEVAALAPGLGRLSVELEELALPARFDTFHPKQLAGTARVFVHVDLQELGRRLPPKLLAGVDPEGSLQLSGHFSHTGKGVPQFDLKTTIRGFRWSPPRDTRPGPEGEPTLVEGSPAFRWAHGDVVLLASRQDNGPLSVNLELAHPDTAEPLLQAHLSTSLQSQDQLWAPQMSDWLKQPLQGSVRINRLSTDALPPSVPVPGGASATVSLNAKLDGSLQAPMLDLTAELEGLSLPQAPEERLDVFLEGNVSPERWSASLHASQASTLLASANARGAWSSPLAGPSGASFELSSLEVKANRLPLSTLGAAIEVPLSGEVNVDVMARELSSRPKVQGTIWSGGVSIASMRPQRVRVTLSADPQDLHAQATLEQPTGEARATLQAPLTWQNALPVVDQSKVGLALWARNFDLGFLRSLRTEGVHSIRGILDADIRRAPSGEGIGEGTLTLSGGQIQLDALGQRLENIQAALQLDADGKLTLSRLEAHSRGGRLRANGVAQLEGTSLESAELVVTVPRSAPFPLTIGGSALGEVWGKVELAATSRESAMDVKVNVPRLYLELPEFAGGDLQSLEEPQNIVAGVYLDDGRFVQLPIPPPDEDAEPEIQEAPTPIQLEVTLGDEVWLSRGNQLRARLDGGVRVTVAAETAVVGEVNIVRGSLDVQGREFLVSDGSVTFEENADPSNPVVVATATYEAPNNIEIYARFVGPVESGSLTLSSSPPLSQSEILNVLLFGTTEATPGTGSGGGSVFESTAVAAGGSLVTQGLNSQLRRLTALEVETRIDEVDGQMRPELAVRLSPRVSAELSYAISVPEASQSADRTFITLDVRIADRWTLETTLGDQGTVLADMLWRLRY